MAEVDNQPTDPRGAASPDQQAAAAAIIEAHNEGRKQRAARLARDAVEKWPDEPVFLRLAGTAAFETDNFDEAVSWLSKLVARVPSDGRAHLRLGELHRRASRFEAAADAYAKARAAGIVDEGLEIRSAELAAALGRENEAAAAYRRALEINPKNAETAYNIGLACQRSGDRDGAVEGFTRALSVDPDHARSHRLRANAMTFTSSDAPELTQMTEALARAEESGNLSRRIQLSFALARAHDDLDDRDRAFSYWDNGNRLKRSTINFDIEGEEAMAARTRRVFNNDLSVRFHGQGIDTDVPVFIVGSPGAGTTLVEQILASHPDVFGAGETPYLPHVAVTPMPDVRARKSGGLNYKGAGVATQTMGGMKKGEAAKPSDVPYPDYMPEIPFEGFRHRAGLYLQRLQALAPDARKITDKLPVNFLYLGFIHLAFPKAKIVNVTRDPVDACFSAWRQLYDGQQPFAYDLSELRRFHGIYRAMMTHWHGMMPGAIHDLSYETLVGGPEQTVRELLDFAGLDWDDRCLRFHETDRIVDTPACWAVRRPLNDNGVGAWKRYEKQLAPFAEAMADDLAEAADG